MHGLEPDREYHSPDELPLGSLSLDQVEAMPQPTLPDTLDWTGMTCVIDRRFLSTVLFPNLGL
jgi:hypothetical protein